MTILMLGEPLFAVASNVANITDILNPATTVVFDESIVNALKVMWNYALNGSIY